MLLQLILAIVLLMLLLLLVLLPRALFLETCRCCCCCVLPLRHPHASPSLHGGLRGPLVLIGCSIICGYFATHEQQRLL